ncbi:putative Nitrate Transporter 1.3 [Zostera marina]|uniref:Putative Nitrate Transporter 1.3 n=1 Tax=Zostera marina TaxID=29655 RepID=A0A0K9NKF5_ZOSMR|nr:putative Nitrate Transporter 1.3 [Zostera marina]
MVLQGEVCSVGDEATDYRGNSPDKSKTGGWLGAGLILGSELAERICIMGISMNLVTYLVGDLHITSSKSANIVTNFMGSLHLLAIVGGFLADAKLGRFVCVAFFATLTSVGVGLLTVATSLPSMRPPVCDNRHHHKDCVVASGKQMILLYVSLYIIALGAGSIKANVSGFGTDQFDNNDPKEEKAMIFFFNRFYFCISIGSLFAVTLLVYIQDNISRGVGYGISAVAMAIAVAILLLGTKRYRYKKPQGSPLTVIGTVIYMAWRNRKLPYPSDPFQLNQYCGSKVPHTKRFRCLDKAAIIEKDVKSETEIVERCCTVTQVEEVKMITELLPIWSTCIMFWTVYSQMTTFSVEQATYMDRRITSTFYFPSGSIPVFLFISVLLFTSLNEKIIVPFVRNCITHSPQGISSLQRVGIGLAFGIIAMIVSAVVEMKRRELVVSVEKRMMSVFWLIPQFFMVGAGEAFAYVGMLEFFIREAPEKMKCMSTAFFLTALALGFFVSSLLVSLVHVITNGGWIKNNLNRGRLDYFYWMLAVLGVLNFIVFLFFAMRHQYKVQHVVSVDDRMEELKVCTVVDVVLPGDAIEIEAVVTNKDEAIAIV